MILLADPHPFIVQETVYTSDAAEEPEVANHGTVFAPSAAPIAIQEIVDTAAIADVDTNIGALRLTPKSLE